MRRAIETAPRDGKVVILEDDATGAFELARWSAEALAWVKENGELSKIRPTYWHAMRRDENLLQEGDANLLDGEAGSAGASESPERPSLLSYLGRVELPSLIGAPDVIALRPSATPSPTNVIAIKSEIAPAKRHSASRKAQWDHETAESSFAAALVAAFHCSSDRIESQSPFVAPNVVAPRPVAIPSPMNVTAVKSQITPGKAPAGRGFAVSSIAAAMIAASLIGMYFYFRAEVDTYVTQYVGQRDIARIGTSPPASQEADTQAALSTKSGEDAEQLKRAAETASLELRQSLQQEKERAEALTGELAKARREIEAQAALSRTKSEQAAQLKRTAESETAGMQQSLQQQREQAEALAVELAKARRESEEAAQLKRTAESETAGMQQSLQQQRERVEALTGELATARREIEAQATLSRTKSEEAAQLKQTAESAPTGLQQERERAEAKARRNVEAQPALSSNKDDEAGRLKPAVEAATTGLQQSAQQERDKPGKPAAGPKSTAGPVDARLPLAPNDQTVKWRQGAAEQRAAAEPKGEAARLLERANALLGEGNIGAARVVLERAAEIGSIQATFRLAETYDPLVLSIWRTYGTRGDATKARELYAKAYDGGIKAAKDRSDALQAAGLEAK
jgi:hypothetical protein